MTTGQARGHRGGSPYHPLQVGSKADTRQSPGLPRTLSSGAKSSQLSYLELAEVVTTEPPGASDHCGLHGDTEGPLLPQLHR